MIINWQRWCRLCAKYDVEDTIIKRENVTLTIQKHFSIEVGASKFEHKLFANITNNSKNVPS